MFIKVDLEQGEPGLMVEALVSPPDLVTGDKHQGGIFVQSLQLAPTDRYGNTEEVPSKQTPKWVWSSPLRTESI